MPDQPAQCQSWFDWVSLTGAEFPNDKIVTHLQCAFGIDHEGQHASVIGEGTVQWK